MWSGTSWTYLTRDRLVWEGHLGVVLDDTGEGHLGVSV